MSDEAHFDNESRIYRSLREQADDVVANAMLWTYRKVTGREAPQALIEAVQDAVNNHG